MNADERRYLSFIRLYLRLSAADSAFLACISYHPAMPALFAPLHRRLTEEQMDSPTIGEASHRQALAGLRRINRVSRTAAALLPAIVDFANRKNKSHLRVLDVASGGGDVPVKLASLARDAGITVDLTLFDRSDTALRIADESAVRAGIAVKTITGDAARELPADAFDVVTNSLFLHHLDETDTVAVLQGMRRAADGLVSSGLVLVSDLRRSRRGVMLAHVACRVLSRSPVVHFDGPVSVRAAWTMSELQQLAERAGLADARVTRQWPGRMLLRWERT